MFFRRSLAPTPVTVGQAFRRRRRDHVVETARVLDIRKDGFGIPHVRYELTVERAQSRSVYPAGIKVLALSAFSDAFPDSAAREPRNSAN